MSDHNDPFGRREEPRRDADADADADTHADNAIDLGPIEYVLGQGGTTEMQRFRDHLADDPLAAIEIAETRQLIEQFKGLCIEPSESLRQRLDDLVVVRQSRLGRRQRLPSGLGILLSPQQWNARVALQVAGVVAAALLFFGLLVVLDPIGKRHGESVDHASAVPVTIDHTDQVRLPIAVESHDILQVVDHLSEAEARLLVAWDQYQSTKERREVDPQERLAGWLTPQNQLAALRMDYEHRSHSDRRLAALRTRGHLAAVDRRVQSLASELAAALQSDPESLSVDETAMTLRALLAAGGDRRAAMQTAGQRLARELHDLHGESLAMALAALCEYAIASGEHVADVRLHAGRLLHEVVNVDDETWTRRRPRLLAVSTPARVLAEVGRVFAFVPAFGVDADEALFVRLLLAAHLQERRAMRDELPETLAALAYGFGDILPAAEIGEVRDRLHIWSPVSLAPDYAALYHVVASHSPATAGYARFQMRMRRIGAQPTPDAIEDRAWLCLCLAAGFGAFEFGA